MTNINQLLGIVSIIFADLYGLLLFLGVEPYWVQQWWNTLLYRPYCHGVKEPLYNALSKVLWRTAKKDVLDQVNITTIKLRSI